MTTTEKLQLIRARCVELLEIASKRTPGKWRVCEASNSNCACASIWSIEADAPIAESVRKWGDGTPGTDTWIEYGEIDETSFQSNKAFIAACAGAAEAGWASTVAAIDAWCDLNGCRPFCEDSMDIDNRAESAIPALLKSILTAWEGVL